MRKERISGAWGWESVTAVLSFFGGILAGIFGSLLTASTWILGVDLHPGLRAGGTLLLVITIPLLIFAGYCLDWMERKPGPTRETSPERGPFAAKQMSK
jgi:hypothetical protein